MAKRVIVDIDGNSQKAEEAAHELRKIVDGMNRDPNISATSRMESITSDESDVEVSFTDGGQYE